MNDKPDFYEFDGIRLFLTDTYIEILSSGKIVSPSKNHRQFLVSLARHYPKAASYRELLREVWQLENVNESALKNIQETKRTLVKWLKSVGVECPRIVAERGYRLNCPVVPGYLVTEEQNESKEEIGDANKEIAPVLLADKTDDSEIWRELLKARAAYIIPVSLFYGLLFLIAAILECTYEFDVYGRSAAAWGLLLMLINHWC